MNHRRLPSLLRVLTCLTVLAVLLGHAGRWWWGFDLFANFRLQYGLIFLVCTAGLLACRARYAAALAGAGLVYCLFTLSHYSGWPNEARASAGSDFRLVTFNGYYARTDTARLIEYLREVNADVVVFEELNVQQVQSVRDALPQYAHMFTGAIVPQGAIILSRWPFRAAAALEMTPGGYRAAEVSIAWRDLTVQVLGVHLHWPLGAYPWQMRNREMMGLANLLKDRNAPTLVAGDFNTTPWSAHLARFRNVSGFADCARGLGLAATWPSALGALGIRIDHCFASRHWEAVRVHVGPDLGSDHLPQIVDLRLVSSVLGGDASATWRGCLTEALGPRSTCWSGPDRMQFYCDRVKSFQTAHRRGCLYAELRRRPEHHLPHP